ncbi:hypothetical protein OXX79_003299 [Metschnikowia pulcherrima]
MSRVGCASKSASPADEFPSFIMDTTGGSQRLDNRHKSPQKVGSQSRELRIEVPRGQDASGLGEAFHFRESEPSVSPEFGRITQLPTPVLPSSGFHPKSPERAELGQLDVRKRNNLPPVAPRSRIVSAFAPEPHLKMHPEVSPVSSKNSSQTRTISNPDALIAPEQDAQVPSPPSELDSQLKGRVLIAPTLEKSYVCESVVGTGAFSTVVAARDTSDPSSVVAVKIISFPKNEQPSASSFRSFIVRELGILAHLSHPCIVTLLDYKVSPPISRTEIISYYEGQKTDAGEDLTGFADAQQYFFLDFCPGGDLFNWVLKNYKNHNNKATFWRLASRIVAEIVVAVAHMHKRRIVHRDIKLENILLNESYDCVDMREDPRLAVRPISTITDFGLSKRLASDDQLLTTKCGSQDYVSPELLMGLQYNGKLLDAWAIGVLVYSILENRLPFDLPPPELIQSSGISPSVLRRRRSKHSPAHRIAMIDWDWFRSAGMLQDPDMDAESKTIVSNLQSLVEVLLVRKEKRMSIEAVLESDDLDWIKACVPSQFLS